jgi:uncharacterized protein (DUF983 family)
VEPNRTTTRQFNLPEAGLSRFLVAAGRAARRRCPYCGAGGVFSGWFTLRERCPACHTLYAYEDGYFLGAYVINLVTTELLTVAVVIWMIAGTDLSVLRMQLLGITLAVALPLLFYPIAQLLWVALDLGVHPPGDLSDRPRR